MTGRRPRRAPSLRRRLVAGLLGLVAVGLCTSGALTYEYVRRLVVGRVATAVVATAHAAAAVVTAAGADASTETGRQNLAAALQPLLADDELLAWLPAGSDRPLVLTAGLVGPPVRDHLVQNVLGGYLRADGMAFYPPPPTPWPQVHSVDHIDYQTADQRTPSGVVVVAASLADADHLVVQLLKTEFALGAALLLILAGAGVFVVRQGLRPLDAIVVTAAAITRGERGQRVLLPPGDSEVGRVAAALNQMLDESEASYASVRASEAQLRRFVADASHELRTPLASVRSYAELLRTGAAATPADQTLAVRRIESEAARMSVLVEDLLLLARLDARRPLRVAAVDLADLVREAVDDENTIDPLRHRELVVSGHTRVDGDPDRLRQVVTNLLGNARTHTAVGTAIAVELRGPEPAGGSDDVVRLVVRDHGPGLPAEESHRVFDRFYRGDTARTRRADSGSGTGLGLSIVAAIVFAHHGTVRAEQARDGGARFTVELPASAS